MDIEQKPPWSGRKLASLGEAIVAEEDPPSGCPSYSEVMRWHSGLCSEIASRIGLHEPWNSYNGAFDVSARAKTIDTLREKLIREQHLRLNQVQDVAGVRVDMDGALDQQTAFAHEVAEFFGGSGRVEIKDIRQAPHSGYRAVHLWLRLPAGRVEVQIRTLGQSLWANTYERLGDLVGRQIRYGAISEDPLVREVVEGMYRLSKQIAEAESAHSVVGAATHKIAELDHWLMRKSTREEREASEGPSAEEMAHARVLQEQASTLLRTLKSRAEQQLHWCIEHLKAMERILDGRDELEVGGFSAGIRD